MYRFLINRWQKSSLLLMRLKCVNLKCNLHEITGDVIPPSQVMGIEHMRAARLNKGLAFGINERQILGIHGLLPPKVRNQTEQADVVLKSVRAFKKNLNKFFYLIDILDSNEKLFFKVLSENVPELMPITYTPTIGYACEVYSRQNIKPRGMFITIKDKGHCYDVVKNWPEHDVRAICVTDGERILGLGDLGANGMYIPIGKLILYTALGGIPPHQLLPVCLDVGTNSKRQLDDEYYLGLRQPRVKGKVYDEFIDEFMEAIVNRYGINTLIQFEDFGNQNAFRLLLKYRDNYCTFNDDIQGTAAVTLAGLNVVEKITKKKMSDNVILFLGAGEASLGIAELCVKAMQRDEIMLEEARRNIWLFDIDGLVVSSRKTLKEPEIYYAKDHAPTKDFASIVKEIKPSIIIGASTAAKAFSPEVLKAMASFNERPVVFALSNPTVKAECTAQEAYDHTEGRVLFASGSPFPPVQHGGKTYYTGQGNNAYIFPGVAMGVMLAGIRHIRNEVFLIAAETIANEVTPALIAQGSLYPPLSIVRDCSIKIAANLITYAYREGIASVYPEPKDKLEFVKSHLYDYDYHDSTPQTWKWP